MNCWYSILKFVNNDLTEENLSLGLLMICDGKVFFKYSSRKLEIIKKLNLKNQKLVDFTVKQITKYFAIEDPLVDKLFNEDCEIDIDYIQRLSIYNNGLIRFSKPSRLNKVIDKSEFEKYYVLFIDNSINDQRIIKSKSNFDISIEKDLYTPLKGKVDVDITIKSKQIPSLFFDYHMDAIGVNGAIYAVKAIDLTKDSTPGSIKADIAEYETVIDRLKNFAKSNNIDETHCFLIADPSKKNSPSLSDLYTMLENNSMPHFKVLSPTRINEVVDIMIRKKAQKFSESILNA